MPGNGGPRHTIRIGGEDRQHQLERGLRAEFKIESLADDAFVMVKGIILVKSPSFERRYVFYSKCKLDADTVVYQRICTMDRAEVRDH